MKHRKINTTSPFARYIPLINEVNKMEAQQRAWEQANPEIVKQRLAEANKSVYASAELVKMHLVKQGLPLDEVEQRFSAYLKNNLKTKI